MKDRNPRLQGNRPDGSLLAGVCAGIARALRWNVWVLRALFVGFLALKTIAALAVYAIAALVLHLMGNDIRRGEKSSEDLVSPELSRRSDRIADLEQRFKDLERSND